MEDPFRELSSGREGWREEGREGGGGGREGGEGGREGGEGGEGGREGGREGGGPHLNLSEIMYVSGAENPE